MRKTVSPIVGALATFEMIAKSAIGGPDSVPGRDDVFRDEWDDYIVVDTVCAYDTGAWETGIQRGGGDWSIVEQYEDRERAGAGHAKWVAVLKADPYAELPDNHPWDFGDE